MFLQLSGTSSPKIISPSSRTHVPFSHFWRRLLMRKFASATSKYACGTHRLRCCLPWSKPQLTVCHRTLVRSFHFYQPANGLGSVVQMQDHGSSQTPSNHRHCESYPSQGVIRQQHVRTPLQQDELADALYDVRCLFQMIDCLLLVNKILHRCFSHS